MLGANVLKKWNQAATRLRNDVRGASAVEFAFILPLMLTLFFGLVEVTSGVEADRKVTLTARALSDVISQTTAVTDTQISDSFAAIANIMSPYNVATIKSVVSEVKISGSGQATVAWSKANSNGTARATNSSVTIPSSLAVPNTYLIWSEVSYNYKPAVSWVVASTGIDLKEQFFTRPRQSNCVLYGTTSCP